MRSIKLVRFQLHKCGVDQSDAVERLARCLDIPSHAICIAGTKDKIAVTSQMVSVPIYCNSENEDPVDSCRHAIEVGLRKQNNIRGTIQCSDYTQVSKGVHLGTLLGNYFKIVVRLISCDCSHNMTATIEAARRSLAQQGFINYYGLQRLGYSMGSNRSHNIGRLLLLEAWEDAVLAVLAPRANENEDIRSAKQAFVNAANRCEGAHALRTVQKLMPRRMIIERLLIGALNRFGFIDSDNREEAAFQALKVLPTRSVSMWAKAYQSYVWNCMASAMHESDEETPLDFELPTPGWETNERIRNNPVLSAAAESVLGKDGISIFEKSKSAKLAACRLRGNNRRLIVVPKDVKVERTVHASMEDGTPQDTITLSFSLPPGSYATCAIRELMGVDQGIMLPAFK